jgi:hypothetical protein
MRGERRRGCGEEDVIVARAQKCRDRHDGVAARLVLDDHRLPPARAQPIAEEPRADVDAGARSEGDEELYCALRPSRLRRRWRGEQEERRQQAEGKDREMLQAAHGLLQIGTSNSPHYCGQSP